MPSGKPLVHSRLNYTPKPGDIKLPCNNCLGCRLDRSKQWAIRLMCEAQLHEHCSFLTLTYNDETLRARRTWEPTVPYTPPSEMDYLDDPRPSKPLTQANVGMDSLRQRDVQLLMKRLRYQHSTRKPSSKLKFYAVGEYGDKFGRPHYHIALFGDDFSDDRIKWRTSGNYSIYRSPRLEKAWVDTDTGISLGNTEIGELTIDSAAYVAAYVMKKINGKRADEHYKRQDPTSGEIFWISPEFALMSRGGRTGRGLAAEWLTKYHTDVYPHDHVIHDGRKLKPPRYFDKLLEDWNPAQIAYVRMMREHRAKELADDNTPARLAAKEAVTIAKMALKQRNLE